jgi:FtsH-binding integral membrane protein
VKFRALLASTVLLMPTTAFAESLHAYDGIATLFMGAVLGALILVLVALRASPKPVWLHFCSMFGIPLVFLFVLSKYFDFFALSPTAGVTFWGTIYFLGASVVLLAVWIPYLRRPVTE